MQSIPGKNYRHTRWVLLTKSLVLKKVVERLRQLLRIPQNGRRLKDKSLDSIINAVINQSKKLGEDKVRILNNIADSLNIDRTQFKEYTFFNIVSNPLIHGFRLVFKDKPLDEPGVYLKVDSYTTESELGKEFRHIKSFIRKTMAPIVYRTRVRKKSTGADSGEINFYLKAENMIAQYRKDKQLRPKEVESIVYGAMKELAGDTIPDSFAQEQWDKEIKEKAEKLKMKYYSITERYGLPTLTNLPELLRLIPNN